MSSVAAGDPVGNMGGPAYRTPGPVGSPSAVTEQSIRFRRRRIKRQHTQPVDVGDATFDITLPRKRLTERGWTATPPNTPAVLRVVPVTSTGGRRGPGRALAGARQLGQSIAALGAGRGKLERHTIHVRSCPMEGTRYGVLGAWVARPYRVGDAR